MRGGRRRRGCTWHNRRCSPHMSLWRRALSSWSNGRSPVRTATNLSYAALVARLSHSTRGRLWTLCLRPTPGHNRGLPFRMNYPNTRIIVPVQLRRWRPLDVLIVKDAPRTYSRLHFVRQSMKSRIARHYTDRSFWRRWRMKSRRRVDQSGLSPPSVPAPRLPHPA